MTAFDKIKNKIMPQEIWGIKDNNTGLWLDHYSINVNFCTWSSAANAQDFETEQNANNAIQQWEGGDQEGRFIGSNPPNPPK